MLQKLEEDHCVKVNFLLFLGMNDPVNLITHEHCSQAQFFIYCTSECTVTVLLSMSLLRFVLQLKF